MKYKTKRILTFIGISVFMWCITLPGFLIYPLILKIFFTIVILGTMLYMGIKLYSQIRGK